MHGKLFLTKGKAMGRAVWHYVRVDALKLPLFQHALKTDAVDVASYGQVICSGWGAEPPEDVRERMESQN